ncbi:amidohydrolase [Tenacibaculum amylolyticum]|uniref:amidohydrolase n=1 Tax=Tenacibaculum amylolyticum TaxID=104269 RepID=UPI0038948AE6
MNTLQISLLQANLVWENPTENLAYFTKKIEELPSTTNLIILPEMFSTGFSMNASALAETMDGETVAWMKNMAQQKEAAVVGSIIIKVITNNNTVYCNRLLFVFPSGAIEFYDKRHTFTLAKEHETYTAGTQKLIVTYKDWKICPLICYDLRFPVWARNVENYDLLIYIASWPEKRVAAWDALLKARAIENMSYTIGVNRIGKDGNDYDYVGHSIVVDALGNALSKENNEDETAITLTVHKNEQNSIREKLGFLNDKDVFEFR